MEREKRGKAEKEYEERGGEGERVSRTEGKVERKKEEKESRER